MLSHRHFFFLDCGPAGSASPPLAPPLLLVHHSYLGLGEPLAVEDMGAAGSPATLDLQSLDKFWEDVEGARFPTAGLSPLSPLVRQKSRSKA